MSWRVRIEEEGAARLVVARDPAGAHHAARLEEGRLTPLGAGPHQVCRLAAALGLAEAVVAPPEPDPLPLEAAARREVAVSAPLAWASRLQAAAELDRLSGVVADELAARGVPFAALGLAPALLLRSGEAALWVRLGTLREMRAALAEEAARFGLRPGKGPVEIVAMAITAFGPAERGEGAAPAPLPELPRLALSEGGVAGPGLLETEGGALVIEDGWTASPAEAAIARIARRG